MEDVLEVYSRPREENCPLVCLDEFCKQLVADVRPAHPTLPGRPARVDYEYERRGMCSIFMVYAPLEQWREVRVTGQRTAVHWAQTIKWICDEVYPLAEKIVLVQDNLNTHTPASLYEAFEPQEGCGSRRESNGITRPNTEAGSTWRKSKLGWPNINAFVVEWQMSKPLKRS